MTKVKSPKRASAHHVGRFNVVEMSVVSQLIQGTDMDRDVLQECVARGLFSSDLSEPLVVARFLSRTILAAQSAQRRYGVPASVLVSLALYESAWEAEGLLETAQNAVERPGCACCYSPEIQKWFFAKAKLLAEPPYSKALPLVGNPRAYVQKIFALGLGSKLDAGDIVSPIERYGLEKCDMAGWLEAGEYRDENNSIYWSVEAALKARGARHGVASAA